MRVRSQSKLYGAGSYLNICLLPSNQTLFRQEMKVVTSLTSFFEVPGSGRQRALSYQAKELQEDEVIEEHDAV